MVNMLIPLDINLRSDPVEPERHSKYEHSTKQQDSPSSEPTTPHSQSFNEEITEEPTTEARSSEQTFRKSNRTNNRNSQLITNTDEPSRDLSENNPEISLKENLSINGSDTDSGYDPTKNATVAKTPSSIPKNSHIYYKQDNPVQSYDVNETGYAAWKFVSKFVEHVCMESNLSDTQRQALLNNLAEVISMQIQMLETVFEESKRVPLRTKPKFEMLKPDFMLPGEYFIEPTPLRCHLVPDGREELSGLSSGTILLPAEGRIFDSLLNICKFRIQIEI